MRFYYILWFFVTVFHQTCAIEGVLLQLSSQLDQLGKKLNGQGVVTSVRPHKPRISWQPGTISGSEQERLKNIIKNWRGESTSTAWDRKSELTDFYEAQIDILTNWLNKLPLEENVRNDLYKQIRGTGSIGYHLGQLVHKISELLQQAARLSSRQTLSLTQFKENVKEAIVTCAQGLQDYIPAEVMLPIINHTWLPDPLRVFEGDKLPQFFTTILQQWQCNILANYKLKNIPLGSSSPQINLRNEPQGCIIA